METLEIKHLAPYLPYGLMCRFEKNVKEHNKIQILKSILNINDNPCGNLIHPISQIKPILKPLSDLQSVINHNKSINEHTINKLIQDKHFLDYGVFSHYRKMLDIELDGDPSLQYDKNKSISLYVVLDIYNELLKGHYDIFGLIDKGLAIDINTI